MAQEKPSGVAASQAMAADIGRSLQGHEPAAWAAFPDDSSETGVTALNRQTVEEIAVKLGWKVAALYRSPRWIPVEERLPDEEAEVLVAWNLPRGGQQVDAALYSRNGMWASSVGHSVGRVTHWMPLPEPPQPSRHTG